MQMKSGNNEVKDSLLSGAVVVDMNSVKNCDLSE